MFYIFIFFVLIKIVITYLFSVVLNKNLRTLLTLLRKKGWKISLKIILKMLMTTLIVFWVKFIDLTYNFIVPPSLKKYYFLTSVLFSFNYCYYFLLLLLFFFIIKKIIFGFLAFSSPLLYFNCKWKHICTYMCVLSVEKSCPHYFWTIIIGSCV